MTTHGDESMSDIDISELRRWLELSRDKFRQWANDPNHLNRDYYDGTYRMCCDVIEHLDLMAEGHVRKMPRD